MTSSQARRKHDTEEATSHAATKQRLRDSPDSKKRKEPKSNHPSCFKQNTREHISEKRLLPSSIQQPYRVNQPPYKASSRNSSETNGLRELSSQCKPYSPASRVLHWPASCPASGELLFFHLLQKKTSASATIKKRKKNTSDSCIIRQSYNSCS